MMKKFVILIIGFVFLISFVSGATYYVSPSGTMSWSSCTSIATPCSLATANANAAAGDTVLLRGGEYIGTNENRLAIMPSNDGQANNYITFQAYPEETPILRKYGIYKSGLRYYSLIVLLKKEYIKIKGITVHEPISSWFSVVQSNHIIFEDMVFDKFNQIPSGRPGQINESSYITFDNCYFNAGDLPTDYGDEGIQTDMVNIWGDSDHLLWIHCDFRHTSHNEVYYSTSSSQYTVFYDCTFSNKWRHAVTQRIGPHMMEKNTFFNMGEECGLCPWFADRCAPPYNRMPGTIYTHGLDHSIIRNNVIYNSFGSFSFGEQYKNPEYNWIYHNTLYKSRKFDGENHDHGIMWYDESHPDQAFQNNHFINNIMYDTDNDYDYIIKVRNVYGDGLNPNNNVISNNLLGDPQQFKIQWGDSIGTLSQIEDAEPDWVKGTNIDGDPMFVDTDITDPDLSLQQDSPAIDKATWLATIKSVSGNVITVDDATPFFSGPGAPWYIIHPDIKADTIYNQVHDSALIQSIDYDANKLTVDSASGFSVGDNLTVVDFSGTLPDIGAYEYVATLYCGDGTCNNGETCSTCSLDCGTCLLGNSLANNNTMISNSNNFDTIHPVEHLWDGCLENTPECSSGLGDGFLFWVEFDFGDVYDLNLTRLFGDTGGNWISRNWSFYYKLDSGDSWSTAFEEKDAFMDDWSSQSLDVNARYVRVEVFGNPSYPATQARELEIYGILSTGSVCGSSDANSDSIISINELINYISEWKMGSVTINELIDAIGEWKNGC